MVAPKSQTRSLTPTGASKIGTVSYTVSHTYGVVSYTVSYAYDLADRVTQMTYPSGRQVQYVRDAQGRITAVNSRKISSAAYTSIATGIAYQPLSRLITGLTHGNGLLLAQTHTADYELARHRLLDGAATVIDRTLARADKLNVTGITDAVTPANSMSFGYTAANRLNASTGPYGTLGWQYDGVGNRTQETIGGAINAYAYPATSNRISSISTGGSAVRQMTYDGGGNMLTDVRLGSTYAYTYNNANRLKTASYEGNLRGTYTYNGLEQLIVRVVTNLGTANGTTHYIHDRGGNIIAETNGTAATAAATLREYIWLLEAEIAPTMSSRTVVDMPVAVVDGVNLPTPATWMVHTDHLHRPIRMTDAARAAVWQATWQPFGAPYQITGSAILDARFPGQWFQLEAG